MTTRKTSAEAVAAVSLGGGVACAVLMPHAPILVPGIAGERGVAAAATSLAMRKAAACVMRHEPESIVLISPHAPRHARAFGVWADNPVVGTFAPFNAPDIGVSFPLDEPLVRTLIADIQARHLVTWPIQATPLDHGALVPLWFLAEAGWHGPIVVLSLNDYPNENALTTVGQAIAAAAQKQPRRVVIIASGDMSHRLTANAPCGYHPQAHQFDQAFIRLIRTGDYRKLEHINPGLRELAAEDVLDSTVIAAAAADWRTTGHQVLQYEGPFGVGYGVAILFAEQPGAAASETNPAILNEGARLPGLAWRAVESYLAGSAELPPLPTGDYSGTSHGVFVTLRRRDGELRGCMGTIIPACANLLAETWRNARLAAFEDPRFDPVTRGEVGDLHFEVSVLHSQETIAAAAGLDPQRYGVIVSAADGRRGLLLPGIEGIATSAQQVWYARQKGGIGVDEPITLERFQVDRFEE